MPIKLIAIAFSDLHLNEWSKFNEDNRRLKDGLRVIDILQKKCKKAGVPLLFPGDLFHLNKYLTNGLLSLVLPFFNKLRVDLYAIDGNHDQSDNNSKLNPSPSYIRTFASIFKRFHEVNFKSLDLGTFVLHGIPYLTHNIGFEEAVNSIEVKKGKVNILMIHTDLHNAKDTDGRKVNSVTNIPTNMDTLFKRFTLVLSGHIHKPQILGSNILMLGATNQQRRTDMGCKMGYWEIYSDGSYKFRQLKDFPVFIDLEPGQQDDGFNFCTIARERKGGLTKTIDETKFTNTTNRASLAKNYCKEKKVKDKRKRNVLKKYLTNA